MRQALAQFDLVGAAVTLRTRIAVWICLIWERLGIANGIDAKGAAQNANFSATGAANVGADISPRTLIELSLEENDRRLSGHNTRLLRPTMTPGMAKFASRFLKK
jgi:hypothetical protein